MENLTTDARRDPPQSPQQQRIFDLLKRADKLIGDMMPGIRYMAWQDPQR